MTAAEHSAQVISAYLAQSGIEFEEAPPRTFVAVLPGVRKQRTTVALACGERSVSVNAFVARHPDENEAGVHAWLLERNRRMYCVSFAIDHLGDIYLVGHIPHAAVSDDELDTVLGSVLEYADGSFNTILELGFATSIRREWEWRTERGLSTDNLQAFAHLATDHQAPEPAAQATIEAADTAD